MSTHHANPNEVVDLKNWANDLPEEKSKVIIKTEQTELARLVLREGDEFREHRVSGPITVHCISGEFDFTAMGITQTLNPGQLIYLAPDAPHSLKAHSDSVILLTIIFE